MGQNTNIGQDNAVTVFGNPESFKKLINNHGILCKVKQALICPCVATNHGSVDYNCESCQGEGYIFTYQRRFLVSDENSRTCGKEVYPYWVPVVSIEKVQNVTSEIQGGITEYEVESFTDDTITLSEEINNYEKKRVTYYFDGWTLSENDPLVVDAANGLMYTTATLFDAAYQSSNPLKAHADIAQILKIWNIDTGIEITNYTFEGNLIKTSQSIVSGKMYANYYYSDLTKSIATDIANRNANEQWTHEMAEGQTRMAFYPFFELSRGDIITFSAIVLYRNELVTHTGDIDQLFEIEVFSLNNVIIDANKNIYVLGVDYILQGRSIKWISANKPALNSVISIRYGYKPSYVVFEDNPQPNNLENKQYPILVDVKSWTKTSKDDLIKLINS